MAPTTMHEHIVKSYDEDQKRLLDEILRMGAIAAAQLEAALDVVERRDDKAAERIIANDEAIDALEREIDHGVIARAVALRPEVLLLDEPTSALDPISTSRIEQLVEDLKKDYTIAIVTHNMQQAARVSDFTAFMYLGDLIEHDTTETIFSNPSKQQTEDYITGRFG